MCGSKNLKTRVWEQDGNNVWALDLRLENIRRAKKSKNKKGGLVGPPFFATLEFLLERELGHYLKDTSAGQGTRKRAVRRGRWAGGLNDLTEIRAVAGRVDRVLKVRVIQHVVRIGPELKSHPLRHPEILSKAEVSVEVIRPPVAIPADITEPSRRGITARIARSG